MAGNLLHTSLLQLQRAWNNDLTALQSSRVKNQMEEFSQEVWSDELQDCRCR